MTIDFSRKAFGHPRLMCDCFGCSALCKHMPGMLIPDDLPALERAIAPRRLEDCLQASPGGVLKDSRTGATQRIPSLTPRSDRTGRCMFLSASGTCEIHAVSPFGCAFFDSHGTFPNGEPLLIKGLKQIWNDFRNKGRYAQLWTKLWTAGRRGRKPEEARAACRKATGFE